MRAQYSGSSLTTRAGHDGGVPVPASSRVLVGAYRSVIPTGREPPVRCSPTGLAAQGPGPACSCWPPTGESQPSWDFRMRERGSLRRQMTEREAADEPGAALTPHQARAAEVASAPGDDDLEVLARDDE